MIDQQPAETRCHVCDHPACVPIQGYESLLRVTSDCRPWRRGGRLCVCASCGAAQKPTDATWLGEIEQIYRDYAIYHQSGGREQAVFHAGNAMSQPRSARLLERVCTSVDLPPRGRILDVGCGNGALLREFRRIRPGWSLAGTELSNKYGEEHRSLGVEAFYTSDVSAIPGTFDLLALVHVLEHIPQPKDFLLSLRARAEPESLLVVEVPDYFQNPFDLLIADHCSHFAGATLTSLMQAAGYEVLRVATDWVPKEISLISRKAAPGSLAGRTEVRNAADAVQAASDWCGQVVREAREFARAGGPFGLFGTSIAGTWLFSELSQEPVFFVDEDPDRAGGRYLQRPVYHPNELPPGSRVFIAQPSGIGEAIARRLARPGITYQTPGAWPPLFATYSGQDNGAARSTMNCRQG